MLALLDLQEQFKQAMFFQPDETLCCLIKKTNISAEKRLNIYKNNILLTMTRALKAIFPAIYAILEESCFINVVRQYMIQYPPSSSNLNLIGSQFSLFLESFEPLQSLVYLMELADLEWSYYTISQVKNLPFLDLTQLALIAEQDYKTLIFVLHPASIIKTFQFPVFNILNLRHAEEKNIIDLNQGENHLLIKPFNQGAVIDKLSVAEFTLLSAFQHAIPFSEACAQAQAVDANFDVTLCLQKHLSTHSFVDFYL